MDNFQSLVTSNLNLDRSVAANTAARERHGLAQQLGISRAFINVNEIARLTGITPSGIRNQIRQGRFPMLHRRLGSVILIKAEDFLDWYSADLGSQPKLRDSEPADFLTKSRPRRTPPAGGKSQAFRAETAKERTARLKKDATDAMRARQNTRQN